MRRFHHTQVIDLFKETFKDLPIIGIEIGTAEAWLTKSVLLEVPNLQLIYTIDPYLHDPTSEFEAHLPPDIQEDRKRRAIEALANYEGRYVFIQDTSDNAVSLTPDSVDFAWIDGDHRKPQIYKDIINYYPKVKLGGIFGGHDYQHAIPMFREMIEGTIYLGDDWTWWVRKDERCLNLIV
jgi:hypothetical protein